MTVRRRCAACAEPFHHHKADDFPAYLTIFVVGHIVIAGLIGVEFAWAPPVWVHWAAWPALTLVLSLWLLPRLKGLVVALQWATRMHGFESDE